MKIYTYSQAREKLADILEESKTKEVVIRRRNGDMFTIAPKPPSRRSPLDVPGLNKKIARKKILEAIRESSERLAKLGGTEKQLVRVQRRRSSGK
jgi:antitoxin Phd